MARIIKSGLIKVPTQPKDFDLTATGLVFRSYDNQPALEFNIEKQDGTPADLLGATLRLLMYVHDEVDGTVTKEPVPFITKNLITESFLNGHVKYILPEALKAYNGVVETYVYIEYPDGTTSDNIGFTFRIKRSEIDGLAQDKADYFIEDFQQLLQQASLEANKVVEGLDQEIKELQQAAQDANTVIDNAMDRVENLETTIGELEKLREMYIDTLDFEGYDYSGRPNLMPNLDFSKLSRTNANIQALLPYVKDGGTFFVLDRTDPSIASTSSANIFIPMLGRLEKNAHYMATVPIMLSEDFGTDYGSTSIYPYCVTNSTETKRVAPLVPNADCRGKWQFIKKAFTVPSNMPDGNSAPFLQVYQTANQTGKLYIGYDIKIEKIASLSDQATPFQPNLLAEPYNMCREYPNENMVINNVPVTSNAYLVKSYKIKPLVKGKKYTVTLKGTKPSTQTWRPFFTQDNGSPWAFENLEPVPGIPNLWTGTFTASVNSHPTGPEIQIYQVPSTSVGQCKIEWCKLEEGDTRTPIDAPTYKGLGVLDTNDPTKYVWSYGVDGIQDALEHAEQRMLALEDEQEKLDGQLNDANTAVNAVQSTVDQTLAEVAALDAVKQTDATYLAALAKLQELDRYKEYFDKGKSFGTSTAKLTSLEPGTSKALHGTRAVTVSGGTFKATKACRLYFDFSVKFRGATTTPYIYIKVYKNGVEADIEAVAAVGGMRESTGATATLKFQTNAPLKYIVDVNVDDTIEFKIDMGDSPNTIQECRMLYGTVEEI